MRMWLGAALWACGCSGSSDRDRDRDRDKGCEGALESTCSTTRPDEETGDSGEPGDSGDQDKRDCPNGTYTGPIVIGSASVTCTDTTVRFQAETVGLTSGGMVFSQETANDEPQWADNHSLLTYEFDPCGFVDKLERYLDDGSTLEDPLNEYQTDISTVFTCANHYNQPNMMTYAFGVNDMSGNLTDCYAFGNDVQGMKAQSYDLAGEDPDFNLIYCTVGVEGR